MNEETPFLEAIAANPEDDTNRLVYADWLEERGDLRGEFLRLESQLTRLRPCTQRYLKICVRLQELREVIDPAWRDAAGQRYDVFLLRFVPQVRGPLVKVIGELTGNPETADRVAAAVEKGREQKVLKNLPYGTAVQAGQRLMYPLRGIKHRLTFWIDVTVRVVWTKKTPLHKRRAGVSKLRNN